MSNQTPSTKATDIYALGLVYWQILTRKEPTKLNEFNYVYKWVKGAYLQRERIPDNCPPSWNQLILECWEADQSKRPSAEQLVKTLEKLGVEFDSERHSLIMACEKLENLIHPRRKEIQSYIAPFVTKHYLEESTESYWNNIESSKEKTEKFFFV